MTRCSIGRPSAVVAVPNLMPPLVHSMTDQGIVILGIVLPSSSTVFLTIVAVHVVAGLVCVLAGAVATLSPKRAGRHPGAGTLYYWSLVVVSLSMTALSIMRWPADTRLLVLAVFSFGVGAIGRTARRGRWHGWIRIHIVGMALPYILLLTAFYGDNGPFYRSGGPCQHSRTGWVLASWGFRFWCGCCFRSRRGDNPLDLALGVRV